MNINFPNGETVENTGFFAPPDQLEQVLAMQPHDAEGWCHRAELLTRWQCYEEALSSLEQAEALAGLNEPKLCIQKAVLLILLSYYSEAFACCENVLQQDPNHPQAWLFRGVACHRLGRYREAYRSYGRATPPTGMHAAGLISEGMVA